MGAVVGSLGYSVRKLGRSWAHARVSSTLCPELVPAHQPVALGGLVSLWLPTPLARLRCFVSYWLLGSLALLRCFLSLAAHPLLPFLPACRVPCPRGWWLSSWGVMCCWWAVSAPLGVGWSSSTRVVDCSLDALLAQVRLLLGSVTLGGAGQAGRRSSRRLQMAAAHGSRGGRGRRPCRAVLHCSPAALAAAPSGLHLPGVLQRRGLPPPSSPSSAAGSTLGCSWGSLPA